MTKPPIQIFTGAAVHTMDDAHPAAEAVAIDGERIVAVGSERDVRAAVGPGATETHLEGGALLPGFIDAHHHYSYAVLDHGSPDLRLPPGAGRMADLLAIIVRAAAAKPPGWVYLCGYEASDLRERRAPDADELEECCPGRPLFVQAANGHQGVLNRSGLEAMQWGAGTPDPVNGQLVRRRGRPTGELVEAAAFLAEAAFRDRIVEDGPDRWIAACEAHGRDLLALGITRVGDAAVAPSVERLYIRAAEEGRLPLTVHPMPIASTNLLLPRFDGDPTGAGPARAPIGPAKLFVDGGHRCAMCFTARETASIAAALLRNTLSGSGLAAIRSARRSGRPHLGRDLHLHAGMRFWESDALADAVAHGSARGFQVAQHAIGNEAIEQALGAIDANATALSSAPGRPRLEHVVFPRTSQLRGIADSGAVAVVQPSFVREHGDDMLLTPMPRGIGMLPLRGLAEAGVELAGSSDYPVTSPDVLRAIETAFTRRTAAGGLVSPEESIDVETMLRAYTIGSARALGVEGECGSIAPGKRADLVHLSSDPLDCDPSRLSRIEVARTWVAGRLAHGEARRAATPEHRPI